MHRSSRIVLMLVLALNAQPGAAATLHCVAVNDNVTCAGDGAASCQTIDGHSVCTSGNGAVVQSFGAARPRSDANHPGGINPDMRDDPDDADDPPPPPRPAWRVPQPAGRGIDGLPATRTPPGVTAMSRLVPALLVLALASPAAAQDVGGLPLAPGVGSGPTGLARLLPFVPPSISASDIQASLKATDHTARHQALVARTRGDAGYLGGFSMGVPLSASVQKPVGGPVWYGSGHRRHDVRLADDPATGTPDSAGLQQPLGQDPGRSGRRGRPTVIVNNTFDGPVAITRGNGNVVQQQSASGAGPIALQQVSSSQGALAGGAVNTAASGGNSARRSGR